jgi:hypothetical protein
MSAAKYVPSYFWPSEQLNQQLDNALEWISKYYILSILIVHILYIILFFGLLKIDPSYISRMNIGIQFFIGLYLIWRFHPLRTHEYRKYDSRIIFGSGVFLLTNLGFVESFNHMLTEKGRIITTKLINNNM